jgi:Domain of unknown function (DUF5130)
VPGGEAFNARQKEDITRVLNQAEKETGLRFSLYVGPLGTAPRVQARKLHALLGTKVARNAVFVAVDPGSRRLEIVTGSHVRSRLDDRSCALASLSMTSSFAAGDLAAGIISGIATLAEHARQPRRLHAEP